jgi:hypothetical protein
LHKAFDKAFRPPAGGRVTFFDWPKKVTKEGHPNCRAPPGILPCGDRKRPAGSADGPSWTAADDAHPCASPVGPDHRALARGRWGPGECGRLPAARSNGNGNGNSNSNSNGNGNGNGNKSGDVEGFRCGCGFAVSSLVIPAKAGIQLPGSVFADTEKLDTGLRRYDGVVEAPRFGR